MPTLRDLKLTASKRVPAQLLSVRFARSGGPGGQNVNKVETKVDLRLDLEAATEALGEAAVGRIREKLQGRIDARGHLRVVASEHREQGRNLEAALARMESLLRGALRRPRARRPTRPTLASREERLSRKRQRSDLKRRRGRVDESD